MGSLFKSPKIPTPPAVRQEAPVTTPTVSEPVETGPTDQEIQQEAREQSLLRRNRGRFGTITTGFTGFLSPTESSSTRKTLLGE